MMLHIQWVWCLFEVVLNILCFFNSILFLSLLTVDKISKVLESIITHLTFQTLLGPQGPHGPKSTLFFVFLYAQRELKYSKMSLEFRLGPKKIILRLQNRFDPIVYQVQIGDIPRHETALFALRKSFDMQWTDNIPKYPLDLANLDLKYDKQYLLSIKPKSNALSKQNFKSI